MTYERLASRIYNVPLAIMPEKAEVIEAVFHRYASGESKTPPGPVPETAEARAEREQRELAALLIPARRTEHGYARTDSGVGIVAVHGTLVQRAGGLDALSGLSGYNTITSRLDAALRDPMVRGIVLDVDSPGGEVAGVFELAAYIADAPKLVWAVANELAASAAYLIASSARRLYLPAAAQVGSIGVAMLHADRSAIVEKSGVRYTAIYAGAKKIDGTSLMPLSDSARADMQRRVDEVYAMFVDAVASYRGIKPEAIRDTEAGMLSAEQAIAEGFADGIGSLTTAVQAMQTEVSAFGYQFTPRAARASTEEQSMSDGTKGAPPASTAQTTEQAIAKATADGIAEGTKLGKAEGAKEGAAAERARVKAILQADQAKERPVLAQHLAFDTDMAAEAAIAMLGKAGVESRPAPTSAPAGTPKALLDAAMGAQTNPQVAAEVDAVPPANVARINTSAIYQRLNQTLADAHKAR